MGKARPTHRPKLLRCKASSLKGLFLCHPLLHLTSNVSGVHASHLLRSRLHWRSKCQGCGCHVKHGVIYNRSRHRPSALRHCKLLRGHHALWCLHSHLHRVKALAQVASKATDASTAHIAYTHGLHLLHASVALKTYCHLSLSPHQIC